MAGRDSKGYYNSGTYGSPTKTELKRITNVKLPESMSTSKFKMRGYEGTVTSVGYIERSVTFTYQKKKPGRADTVLDALLTAMRTRTAMEFWFVDQAIATVGAEGVHGFFNVVGAPLDEADDDNPTREFTLEPADHEEDGDIVEVEPYTTPS